MSWKTLFIGVGLCAVLGCRQQSFLTEPDYHDFHALACPPLAESDLGSSMTPLAGTTPPPATVDDTKRQARYLSLREAILQGAEKRVRPVMMTTLTAILGLLPAALSTRIGAQSQRPLAIVVVGGMIMTLLLNRYLMPVLYSFYGHREPAREAASMAH